MDRKYLNNWVSQSDVCRCCLSARGTCDITISVSDTGQKEFYNEMLQETFGISLSHLSENIHGKVCSLCIAQLKLAYAFKNQVLQSERHFNLFYKTQKEYGKIENVKETSNCKEPEIIKKISKQKDVTTQLENGKQIVNCRKEQRSFLKPNVKVKLAEKKKKAHKLFEKVEECSDNTEYDSDTPIAKMVEDISCKNNRNVKTENGGNKSEIIDEPRHPAKISDNKHISERKRLKITCLTILQNTTACPFRHYKSWFRCFFCPQDFIKIQHLKEHTITTHTNLDAELRKMKRYPRSIQIEISDLVCKQCGFKMENVAIMKNHLQLSHHEIIYSECIADYKIDTTPYSCHICEEKFHVFRTLTTHLNVHYANYICDVCGRPFLNAKRLKVHYRIHEKGTYPCKLCDKVLSTKSSRSNHMESAHSKRILKCQVCQKPMKHYNARVKHMSEVHNITHSFKCNVCGKDYNVKHYLATHMRQSHGSKDKKCDQCGMAFITGHSLKKHMRKHSGEKPFSCLVCTKSYARAYTLREHMRMHDPQPTSVEKT